MQNISGWICTWTNKFIEFAIKPIHKRSESVQIISKKSILKMDFGLVLASLHISLRRIKDQLYCTVDRWRSQSRVSKAFRKGHYLVWILLVATSVHNALRRILACTIDHWVWNRDRKSAKHLKKGIFGVEFPLMAVSVYIIWRRTWAGSSLSTSRAIDRQ